MNTIHYINKEQVDKLKTKPSLGFEWFESSRLKPDKPFKDKYTCSVDNIVCYSEEQLHIIVRSDQENIVSNDRSYQNGDGFHFVLARPMEDNMPSREFYVIGISPLDDTWKNRFVWYKNVDLGSTFLKDTQIHMSSENAHIFHVMIPWYEIEPVNGYLMKDYGYNISYVQAHDEGKNVYILKEDDRIQSEQSPREYEVLSFEESVSSSLECHGMLSSKHGNKQDSLKLHLALSSQNAERVEVTLKGEKVLLQKHLDNKGLSHHSFDIDTDDLVSGKQALELTIKGNQVKTVMLEYNLYDESLFNELINRVDSLDLDKENPLFTESVHTIHFDVQTLKEKLRTLKPYESYDAIEDYYQRIVTKIDEIEKGHHLFLREEVIRLGHLSDYDDTLQPYSIYIPKAINDRTKLMVYLHGSGSDDTSMRYAPNMKELANETNTILLAPYARGTSHFYCSEESITDVLELTRKAIQWFGIRSENVLISGFSMGGYGSYRLYDAANGLFTGMIVLSGHPSLGTYHGGPDYKEYINVFKDVPIIIGHGALDRNCDYHEQVDFFDELKNINDKCHVLIKEDIGHCGLTDDWYEPIKKWIGEHYGY